MKNQFKSIAIFAVASLCIFSCKKKSDSTPTPAAISGTQITINNKTYTASTHVNVPNDSALFSGSVHPVISSTGSYLSYTAPFTENTGKVYAFVFYQANISSPGDTISAGLEIQSPTAIAAGTYSLYGPGNIPNSNTFGVVMYNDSKGNYKNSIANGTVTITQIDMVNKVISGTYNYTATGANGSSPAALTVTNGAFINIPIQEF